MLKVANCSHPLPALRSVAYCTFIPTALLPFVHVKKHVSTHLHALMNIQDLDSGLFQNGIEASDSGYETMH